MINKKEVEKLAFLGRVELTKDELEAMPKELESILSYVQKLSEVDTEEVDPLFHFSETANVVRDDCPEESSEELREGSKETKKYIKNYLKVKSIWG